MCSLLYSVTYFILAYIIKHFLKYTFILTLAKKEYIFYMYVIFHLKVSSKQTKKRTSSGQRIDE